MINLVGRSVEIPFRDVPPGLINMLFGGIVSGEVGYRTYCEAVGGRAYNGDALPQWADVPEHIRAAWSRAADAIVAEACGHGEKTTTTIDGCACGHLNLAHDIAEADGSGRRCCVAGCGCGSGGR